MPYEDMLKLWLAHSGRDENQFWIMTAPEYFRWLAKALPKKDVFTRQQLSKLMAMFPDVH